MAESDSYSASDSDQPNNTSSKGGPSTSRPPPSKKAKGQKKDKDTGGDADTKRRSSKACTSLPPLPAALPVSRCPSSTFPRLGPRDRCSSLFDVERPALTLPSLLRRQVRFVPTPARSTTPTTDTRCSLFRFFRSLLLSSTTFLRPPLPLSVSLPARQPPPASPLVSCSALNRGSLLFSLPQLSKIEMQVHPRTRPSDVRAGRTVSELCSGRRGLYLPWGES